MYSFFNTTIFSSQIKFNTFLKSQNKFDIWLQDFFADVRNKKFEDVWLYLIGLTLAMMVMLLINSGAFSKILGEIRYKKMSSAKKESHIPLSFENFYNGYVNDNKEFAFVFDRYVIIFLHEREGHRYIKNDCVKKRSLHSIIENCQEEYFSKDSKDVINNFHINGKGISDIWTEVKYF